MFVLPTDLENKLLVQIATFCFIVTYFCIYIYIFFVFTTFRQLTKLSCWSTRRVGSVWVNVRKMLSFFFFSEMLPALLSSNFVKHSLWYRGCCNFSKTPSKLSLLDNSGIKEFRLFASEIVRVHAEEHFGHHAACWDFIMCWCVDSFTKERRSHFFCYSVRSSVVLTIWGGLITEMGYIML